MALGRKTGGRVAGTPNKPNPLKECLRAHSTEFFSPSITVDSRTVELFEALERPCPFAQGDVVSQFDIDLALMEPSQRVDAEIKLLQYHTPKMQSVAADVNVTSDAAATLESYLASLTNNEGTNLCP